MQYPHYRYPIDSLFTGSSLGNYYTFARLDEQTNLRGLWSSIDNQYYAGEWDIDIIVDGKSLLSQETVFFPESQITTYSAKNLEVEKQFFVPYLSDLHPRADALEQRSAIYFIRLNNSSSNTIEVTIRHRIYFPANFSNRFIKQPLRDQTEKRVAINKKERHCEVVTSGKENEVRIFGSPISWIKCDGDNRMLTVEYRVTVQSRQNREVSFIIAFSPNGPIEALECYGKCGNAHALHEQAIANHKEILSRSFIFTPEPAINRGLQWAKIDTVRVQHRYRIGEGFTNDPPQDIVVLRDLAWYVLGSDYLTPMFSKNMLALAEQYGIHADGKVTEYLHADEQQPEQHDYKLNINDDTPLYVYALYHHALTGGPEITWTDVYPFMKRTCEYILSQMTDGLVRCNAEGVNVWGICGWRNIIDNYNLTGAVTEINAECYHAFQLTAEVAEMLGNTEDSVWFRNAAEHLKIDINTKLVSEKTGMYLLNLGNDGVRHHDMTGDLIFPVLFGLPNDVVKEKILQKLTDHEMWTPYGSRTVSKEEPNYDPDFGYQLVGGIWHNLTAWIGYCLRGSNPGILVEGLLNIYRLSETERPKDFLNVVPGEFPERMHGESYQSKGMAMSPWMPPTYLWLGVEGLLGLKPLADGLELNPHIPADWNWVGVKNLLYKGKSINAFLHDGVLYSTIEVSSSYPLKTGKLLDVISDNDKIFSIGLNIESEILLFIACDEDAIGNVGFRYNGVTYDKFVTVNKGKSELYQIPARQSINIKTSVDVQT